MKTLFLAWQASHPDAQGGAASRAWYPIGRLDFLADENLHRFSYTQGVRTAQQQAGFAPLDAFPKLEQVYESTELFSLFKNRLISPKRRDYAEFIERLALDPANADPMDVLAISEGKRQTDNLEVFPQIQPRRDGSFACRFFLHGWRYTNEHAQARLARLREGERLRVAVELNNPATGAAIQLQDADDYFMLGWSPRYLVQDLLKAMAESHQAIEATVVRLNPEPAPHNQRVLVELSGKFPASYHPMDSAEFQPLMPLADTPGPTPH
jgi:hypothetical protein